MTDDDHTAPELPLDDDADETGVEDGAGLPGVDTLVTALDKRQPDADALRQTGDGALDAPPKSLPVLAAFQEFIDEERKRSQARTFVITGFFLVVLIAVIGTGLTIGSFVYRQMRDDVTEVRNNFRDLEHNSVKTETRLSTALARFEGQSDGLRYQVDKQDEALEKTRESLAQQDQDYKNKLAEMRKVIASLETENASLKSDLTNIRTDLPNLTQKVAVAISELENELDEMRLKPPTAPAMVPAATPAAPAATAVATAPPATAVPAAGRPLLTRGRSEQTLVIPIRPRGLNQQVDWQVVIPE